MEKVGKPMYLLSDLPPHIEKRITVEGECWTMQGGTDYAYVTVGGWTKPAHRWVYEHLVGPIKLPHLHHVCGNTKCVNPEHMQPITVEDHMKIHNYYSRSARCEKGHKATDYIVNGKPYCRTCARLKLND